jgi:hypothetical protein
MAVITALPLPSGGKTGGAGVSGEAEPGGGVPPVGDDDGVTVVGPVGVGAGVLPLQAAIHVVAASATVKSAAVYRLGIERGSSASK